MIYLPRMTRMQTCLMCWSVGALPWDRKDKSQFVHGTTKRTLFNGKPTGWARKQVAGTRRAGPMLLRSWGLALPPRSLLGWSLQRETPGAAQHSREGPGSQAGRWRPVLPARLAGQGVLVVLPPQEAPGFLRVPSSQVPRGYLPGTQGRTVSPG